MATTFDGDNLLITLNAGGSVHTVNAKEDLYSDWKVWAKIGDNSKYPPAFRPDGGNPLTPGIDQGAYYFIRNDLGWRIKPAEEDATITFIGNLAPQDSSLPILIPTTGAFTVGVFGLQPITQSVETLLTQQQESDYNGEVFIDTIGGTAGTSFPIGTASEPVSNLADGLTIANNIGVRKFRLIGSITLTQSFFYWHFEGAAGQAQVLINGQNISGTVFSRCGISGTITGLFERVVIDECQIDSSGITGFYGAVSNTVFEGNLTLVAGNTIVANCVSNIAGTATPIIDINNVAGDLSVRKWSGGLELRNCNNVLNNISVDSESMHIIMASTLTNGTIVLRGVGKKTDNSAGIVIDEVGFVQPKKLLTIGKFLGLK